MAKLIVLDGCEKAGKSTLAAAVAKVAVAQGRTAEVRHWGPVDSDAEYLPIILDDIAKPDNHVVVWDRSWVSEYVYSTLLGRDRRSRGDPWLVEWLYGRFLPSVGVGAIVHPFSIDAVNSRRDSTDLPVDPVAERGCFYDFAVRYGWDVIYNYYTDKVGWVHQWAEDLLGSADRVKPPMPLPDYAGPNSPSVVVVGERRNDSSPVPNPGGYLPFTSRYTTELARSLGVAAFSVGWTNAYDDPKVPCVQSRLIIPCGSTALAWVERWAADSGWRGKIHPVPHPSWLYRWGSARELIIPTEEGLRDAVSSVLGAQK